MPILDALMVSEEAKHATKRSNNHPTVKPTDLMRYLCRLVTPPSGIVLDPFTGSGSTGKAAILEGFQFIGIEREAEYVEIARARIEHAIKTKPNTLDL
jgi:DNA modification methylase